MESVARRERIAEGLFAQPPDLRGACPPNPDGTRYSNSDPITGQAAWYDVRVRIYPAEAGEPEQTSPQFEPMHAVPGMGRSPKWLAYFGGGKKGAKK